MQRLFLIALLLLPTLHLQSNQPNRCFGPARPYQSDESLTYKVYYTWHGAYVGAGEATFSAKLTTFNQTPVWHVIGEGHTYSSYDWFFRVRDVYESHIDTSTGLPLKFVRRVQEGSNRIFNQVLFNHNMHRAVSQDGVYTIPDCTQDVLSAIYHARTIDFNKFKPGDKIPLTLFLENQVYPVYIRYLGREKITTRTGTFQTIKFKPLLIEGTLFKGGEKMEVWVSDDENRIPVMINTPILVGSIRVLLKSYKNIKHPASGILSSLQHP